MMTSHQNKIHCIRNKGNYIIYNFLISFFELIFYALEITCVYYICF